MVKRSARERVLHSLSQHRDDGRFQHELKEMRETQDLREVDDDVEDVATLLEWHAPEHEHRPKSPQWFAVLAGGATVLVLIFIFMANFIAALTIAFVGGLLYYLAQRPPVMKRYRLMVDGVAIGNTLYHYKEIEGFNIIYEPGHTKSVLVKSQRKLAPLLHLEIGDESPLAIRDILLEFIKEDQAIEEPLVDILARRLGF